jgi:hypothetical protein
LGRSGIGVCNAIRELVIKRIPDVRRVEHP